MTARPPGGPRVEPAAAWALVAAFALHNLEEALTMRRFLEGGGPGRWAGLGTEVLPGFLVAVTLVTVVALALVVAATTGPRRGWTTSALRVLAAVMLVNVVVPHVPAAVAAGGYSPGVVTALAVNLPVAAAFLRRTRPAPGTRAERDGSPLRGSSP